MKLHFKQSENSTFNSRPFCIHKEYLRNDGWLGFFLQVFFKLIASHDSQDTACVHLSDLGILELASA